MVMFLSYLIIKINSKAQFHKVLRDKLCHVAIALSLQCKGVINNINYPCHSKAILFYISYRQRAKQGIRIN